MCLIFGRAYGIPTVALRFFNVYGTRQALSNPYTGVLAIFASRLLNDRAAGDLRGRPAAARLRPCPRRRARLPAALERPEPRAQVAQHRQRRSRTRRARWPAPCAAPSASRDLAAGDHRQATGPATSATASPTSTLARRVLGFAPAEDFDDGPGRARRLARGRVAVDRVDEATERARALGAGRMSGARRRRSAGRC